MFHEIGWTTELNKKFWTKWNTKNQLCDCLQAAKLSASVQQAETCVNDNNNTRPQNELKTYLLSAQLSFMFLRLLIRIPAPKWLQLVWFKMKLTSNSVSQMINFFELGFRRRGKFYVQIRIDPLVKITSGGSSEGQIWDFYLQAGLYETGRLD